MIDSHKNSPAPERRAMESRDHWQPIYDRLRSALAQLLGIDPQEIDPDEPLISYGLGSVQALTLIGDLEDWTGRELSATLLWDYPTLNAITKYLSEDSVSAEDYVSREFASGVLDT
jgi:acyl carrier protein